MKTVKIISELQKKGYYVIKSGNLTYDYLVMIPTSPNSSNSPLYLSERGLFNLFAEVTKKEKVNL